MNPIDHFLERNYIDPIILKYTKFNKGAEYGTYKCGGNCGGYYELSEMTVTKYENNKRVLRCTECQKRYKRRK